MNVNVKNVIVTEHACTACGANAINVHHENFPELRIGGHSAEEAAERLISRLESSLDVVDPPHREPVRQALADIQAFVKREAGMHPARDV